MARFFSLVLTLLFLSTSMVLAMTNGSYVIDWDVVSEGGGDFAESDSYQLNSTVEVFSPGAVSGTTYQARGGYRGAESYFPPLPIPISGGGGVGGSSGFSGSSPAPVSSSETPLSPAPISEVETPISPVTASTDKSVSPTINGSDSLPVAGTAVGGSVSGSSGAGVSGSSGSGGSGGYEAPIIRQLRTDEITDQGALVVWETNDDTATVLEYGMDRTFAFRAQVPGVRRTHVVRLTGLQPGTDYFLRALAVTPTGRLGQAVEAQLRTNRDQTGPPNPASLQAIGQDRQVVLEWINPIEADLSRVVLVSRTDRVPVGIDDGRIVYRGLSTATIDSGLTQDTTYFYAVFALDRNGNTSGAAVASARTWPGQSESVNSSLTVLLNENAASSTDTGVRHKAVPRVFAIFGALEMLTTTNGVRETLTMEAVTVRIPAHVDGVEVRQAGLLVDGSRYILSQSASVSGSLEATFFLPKIGDYDVRIEGQLIDGSTSSGLFPLRVRERGLVSDPFGRPLANAEVKVFLANAAGDQLWNATSLRQKNPFITSTDGRVGFILMPGKYRLRISAPGLVVYEDVMIVQNNLLLPQVLMRSPSIVRQSVATLVRVTQRPEVQQAAKTYVAPTAAVAGAVTTATATSAINLWAYLQYLFTQPLLLFGRRKRKQFGIVYHAFTKQPIDLAVVRLLEAKTKRVLQTRITDAQGRFSFYANEGEYLVQVVKAGLTFPSAYMARAKEDGAFAELYHGEPIQVRQSSFVAVNVPLDPQEAPAQSNRAILWGYYLRLGQRAVATTGIIFSIVSCVIAPNLLTGGLATGQVVLFLVFKRLAKGRAPKGWGVVYDVGSKKTVGRAIVRIFDKKLNKLLETQVTDGKGRYAFFAGQGVFLLSAERPGYQRFVSPDIDHQLVTEPLIAERIGLQKA